MSQHQETFHVHLHGKNKILIHLHLWQQREHSKNLQEQLDAEKISFHEKYKKDIGSLKEQLQVRGSFVAHPPT